MPLTTHPPSLVGSIPSTVVCGVRVTSPNSGKGFRFQFLLLLLCFITCMSKAVADYVNSCDSCQRNKSRNHQPHGKLQPLAIPNERWESVSMDFITHLPKTKAKHDAILVTVDRLSKRPTSFLRRRSCHPQKQHVSSSTTSSNTTAYLDPLCSTATHASRADSGSR